MCGIAGIVGNFPEDIGNSFVRKLSHRGPDASGIYQSKSEGVLLAHTRLAILDLTPSAAQPMRSPDGRFVLVFNGEIYNYKDLRKVLEGRGERFVSSGDTEVLLRGLVLEGEEYLSKLNGIFSFALWDCKKRELLLVRDPLGVKPLYYAEADAGSLVFASEIKAVLADRRIPARPNFGALLQHLSFSHPSGSNTAFRDVRRLDGGCRLKWTADTRASHISRYWTPEFDTYAGSLEDGIRDLREVLERASQRQIISDVPVGAFLSGGLDSTLIAALCAPKLKDSFRTYTITYPESENIVDGADQDGPYARLVASKLGIPHVECEIKPNVVDLWPTLIYHLDEPIADAAAIGCYLISDLARKNNTKVLLSGQGADELFGGYPRYRAMSTTQFVEYLPGAIRRAMGRWGRALPGAREGRIGAKIRRLRRLLDTIDKDPDTRFMSYCSHTPDDAILRVLSPEFRHAIGNSLPSDDCIRHMQEAGLEGMSRGLERDLSVYLPNHNLLYTDKMSMAVGVESRVPLLDLEVVNLATSMPSRWKVRGDTTKKVLRDASEGIVPDEIINRPKAGFGAPLRKWLRYDLSSMWDDIASEPVVAHRGWFDSGGLKSIRELSQSGKVDLYMLQWAVLTIELWARQFIDRNSVKD